jgi:hypothetical protein
MDKKPKRHWGNLWNNEGNSDAFVSCSKVQMFGLPLARAKKSFD